MSHPENDDKTQPMDARGVADLPLKSDLAAVPTAVVPSEPFQATVLWHNDSATSPELSPTIIASPTTLNSQAAQSSSCTVSAAVGSQFGDYELIGEIARGGMGVVFKARQRQLNRIVAIKMILSGALAGDSEVKRFLSEAEAAANLDHPGIVPIFEVGEHGGQHFFSMGFVEGESLAAKISQSPLEPREAAEMLLKISDAVQYAHDNGVIHRDLKPANVLLDKKGQPRVTDFGLAKRTHGDSNLTGAGQILGTPSYMPPEQAAGKTDEITPVADVYALGAILYALVTGRPPFQAASPMDTLLQVLNRDPIAPRQLNPHVPRDLETICLKCLQKEQHRRYGSARELSAELQRYLNDEPILARPLGLVARTWRWCGRKPLVASLIAAAMVLASLVVIVSVIGYVQTTLALGRETQQRERAEAREKESNDAKAVADAARKSADAERLAADEARKAADAERLAAVAARRESERERDIAEQNLYVANMRLGLSAMQSQETERLTKLLETFQPKPGRADLRGWEWYYLRSVCQRSVLSKHELKLALNTATLAWSPKAEHLAAVQAGGAVIVWDEPSGKELRRLSDARATVVVFHPQGTQLATGSADGSIAIWNAAKGTIEMRFKALPAPITAIAFHPDGTRILTGGSGGQVAIHDIASGQVRGIVAIGGDVRAVAWNPTGKEFAAGTGSHQLTVWDTDTREVRFQLKDYNQPLFMLAWSPDGRLLGLSGWNGVQTWKTDSWTKNDELGLREFGDRSMAWSPDGRTLAVGSDQWSIVLLDVQTGKKQQTLRTHQGVIGTLAWSRDGKLLASASHDGAVHIHANEFNNERELSGDGKTFWAVAISPDGKRVAAGGDGSTGHVWDSNTGESVCTIPGFKALIRSIAWNSESSQLAIASYDGTVRVCDASNGKELVRLAQIEGFTSSVSWSRDDSRLISIDWQGNIKQHDAATGQLLRAIAAHQGRGGSVVWSPDERYIASVGADSVVRVSFASGRNILKGPVANQRGSGLRGHTGEVASVVWSPDGTRLASGGLDGTVRIWDVAERRELRVLRGHTGSIFQVAWHPQGQRLASVSTDQTCKLWDVESGQEIISLRSASGAMMSVDWSRDGRQLVATGVGGNVRVWNASRGFADDEPEPPARSPNVERTARLLVDALFDELTVREAVIERLRSDSRLNEPVRTAALNIAKAGVAAPASTDLRDRLARFALEPRSQAARNTCSVFVVTAALEFAHSTKTGRGTRLSPEYLNWACNQVIQNKTDDRGQFFHDLIRGFEQFGISTESDMPYRNQFDPSLVPSDIARQRALPLRAAGLTVNWIKRWDKKAGLTADHIHTIKQTLTAGWPVAAGASHSLLLVGYRDDPATSDAGVFIAVDSDSGAYSEVTYDSVKSNTADLFWIGN